MAALNLTKRMLQPFQFLAISAATALMPGVAKADLVQIGTVTVTSEFLTSGNFKGWSGDAAITNDMTDTMIVNGSIIDGNPGIVGFEIGSGASLETFSWGGFSSSDTFSFLGDLIRPDGDFTVGGITYQAAGLNWSTPTWAADFSGTLAIVVDATAISPPNPITTPEPSSLLLLGTGILSISGFARRVETKSLN